jgi:hypothetical protein
MIRRSFKEASFGDRCNRSGGLLDFLVRFSRLKDEDPGEKKFGFFLSSPSSFSSKRGLSLCIFNSIESGTFTCFWLLRCWSRPAPEAKSHFSFYR